MGQDWVYACSIFAVLHVSCSASTLTSVEPPRNFQIVDPGYLGWMVMQWEPPKNLMNLSYCEINYNLQYDFNDGKRGKAVLTPGLQYRDGFDLSKEITARIRTLVRGPCTHGLELWSEWTEAHLKPSSQGVLESQIQSFQCYFYNWENLICTWQPGSTFTPGTNYEFRYWYAGLPQAITCGVYIQSDDEINVGCNFGNQKLDAYTQMFVRVAGFEASTSPRPSYFVIQLQNIVKPSPPEHLNVTLPRLDGKDSEEVLIEWNPPRGMVPPQCLEYEIHVTEDNITWKPLPIQHQTFNILNHSASLCAKVRGKVNMYCADKGFWSEWSATTCFKASQEPKHMMDIIVFFAIGLMLTLFCIITIFSLIVKKRFNVKEKNIYS